ncbi:MAG: hypothetical protein CVV52_08505 [Spirochaetae bacterium HGW-Spirochaetae-8]|nr:MAG: hypothetical protein CVV52_08505 [Spirochaetae bacterium HGW-Spirochaetae-8]
MRYQRGTDWIEVVAEDGEATGIRVGYGLSRDGLTMCPEDVQLLGDTVSATFKYEGVVFATIDDCYSCTGGLLTVHRSVSLVCPGAYQLDLPFSLDFQSQPTVFVPAVMYRDNLMGRGAFPRRTSVNEWSFLESRTPLPSCAMLYDRQQSFIACAGPAQEASSLSSVSSRVQGRQASLIIHYPGSEWPQSYQGKKMLVSRPRAEARSLQVVAVPLTIRQVFHCMSGPSGDNAPFSLYRKFIQALGASAAFNLSMSPHSHLSVPQGMVDWDTYRILKTTHLLSLVEPGRGDRTACLAMGRHNGALQEIYEYTAGSFLVKSLEAAVVLVRAQKHGLSSLERQALESVCKRLGQDGLDYSQIARMIGNFFLLGERAPGVHQDCYDRTQNIWGGYLGVSEHDDFRYLVNARCNGEVMLAYVGLYEALKAAGVVVPEFLELPKRVARFYIRHQLSGDRDGSFGRWWTPAGRPVNSLGTNGAYIVALLCAIEPYMEKGDGVADALARASKHYGRLVDDGEYFGDTLDADSCDKESGLALMVLFLDMFERDHNPDWLVYARKAGEFVCTWIWQYNIAFPPDSALGSLDFRTLGMTSVSIAHHHLDFYGMSIAYEFLRYGQLAGDAFFEDQAGLLMQACRQLVATPELLLGRGAEDVGWQPEQLNHTGWDYFDRNSQMHGSFDIDIAWVTVLGLGAYQRIARRFPQSLSN